MMKPITHIIIHCSASDWGTMREINKWHKERFSQTEDLLYVGYHFVVLNGRILPHLYLPSMNGSIEAGRRLDEDGFIEANETGAHALGYNQGSIGVCMIGQRNRETGSLSFTPQQFDTLKNLLIDLCRQYKVPVENILGHNETEQGGAAGKTCPDFNVGDLRTWLKGKV
jgi:hypothetical protein